MCWRRFASNMEHIHSSKPEPLYHNTKLVSDDRRYK
jgi:hypothetical protein